MQMIARRLKNSHNYLFRRKSILDLKNFVCYYHECVRRKGVVSMINASGGRHTLNLGVYMGTGHHKNSQQVKSQQDKRLILSKQNVNLIVCDKEFMHEIVSMFLAWRQQQNFGGSCEKLQIVNNMRCSKESQASL